MGLQIDLPDAQAAQVFGPMLQAVGGELAARILRAAQAIAEDRKQGYMDKEEAAAYLGLEVRALENWMKPVAQGGRGLPHMRSGATVRFRRERIDAWYLSLEVNPPAVALYEHAA